VAQSPTNSEYARGALYGLAAVSIWAGFIVVARLGIRTSPTPWDIAAIRFAVSGSLLLPYAIRRGLSLERLGWTGLAAVVSGCGAPMVLLANAGLLFAPAAHAGALFPGVTPLMVAMLAAAILRETFTSQKRWDAPLSLWAPSASSGARVAPSALPRTSDIYSFSPLDWPGPATPSPCGVHGSMASTPPPLRLPASPRA
jgi:EamA-like transporter family